MHMINASHITQNDNYDDDPRAQINAKCNNCTDKLNLKKKQPKNKVSQHNYLRYRLSTIDY